MVYFIIIGYVFLFFFGGGIYIGIKENSPGLGVIMGFLWALISIIVITMITWVATLGASYTLDYEQIQLKPLNDGQFLQTTDNDGDDAYLYQTPDGNIEVINKEAAEIVKDAPDGQAWIDVPGQCRYDYWMNNIVWCSIANPDTQDSVLHVPAGEAMN